VVLEATGCYDRVLRLGLESVAHARVKPEQARDFARFGTARLGRTRSNRAFYKGKDMAAAIKGWDEAAQKLGEHAGPVIEFLKNFLP
jgi:hypothetical protein